MKKTILLSLISLTIVSCVKNDWTCTCKITSVTRQNNGLGQTVTSSYDSKVKVNHTTKKKVAQSECQSTETVNTYSTTNVTISKDCSVN